MYCDSVGCKVFPGLHHEQYRLIRGWLAKVDSTQVLLTIALGSATGSSEEFPCQFLRWQCRTVTLRASNPVLRNAHPKREKFQRRK